MGKKLIIDCDPGIDEAFALAMALFDPRLEVLATTAISGVVDRERAWQNLQSIIELFDPPRRPRVGIGNDSVHVAVDGNSPIHGNDGMGNLNLQPIKRQHTLGSEKLMAELLRQHPGQITILCTGPLTTLARLLKIEPGIAELIGRVVIVGGALRVNGDASAAAEFNMHFEPFAAEGVFKSATTKTLVPLDVIHRVTFGLDSLDKLPPKHTNVGKLLQPALTHLCRTFRQHRASERVILPAMIGLLAVTDPSVFETEEVAISVETEGSLTRGMTIVDRRHYVPNQTRNIEACVSIDADAAMHLCTNSLKYAGQGGRGF